MIRHVAADIIDRRVGAVLSGDDNRVDAHGLAVFVLDGVLSFSVGAEIGERARLADLGKALCGRVCEGDRKRH